MIETKSFAVRATSAVLAASLVFFTAAASETDELLSSVPCACPDELYLEFTKIGNRTHYQKPYGQLTSVLERLIEAERAKRDGRYVAKIAEFLDAVSALRSWTLPAHDARLTCFNGKPHIDLGAARLGLAFAEAIALVGEKLPPATLARAKSELERRIFKPYLATARGVSRPSDHWWFDTENNWNSVCHSCVVRAAILYYPLGSAERTDIVRASVAAVPAYLKGFSDDGYCSEGAGYWNYGYGHFLLMGLALRSAPEKIDLFANYPKTKTVANYGFTYKMSPVASPAFADGSGSLSREFIGMCSSIWPDLRPDLGPRDAFPIAQVWIARSTPGGISLGLKGGHNDEFHNHNDVGSYDIAVGDAIVTGDPGGEVYTQRTFSSRRYESKVLNSYAHPVPRVDGTLQGTGRRFAAKVVSTSFGEKADTVVLDLTGAYACKKLVSLARTFVFDRRENSVTVSDRVRFSSPATFDDPLVTLGSFADGCVSDGGASLKVETDARGGEWTWWEETVSNPGKRDPKIRGVRFASVTDAEVTFVFKPGCK